MPHKEIGITLALIGSLVLTALTACGGSSSTASGAGTTVTASFKGATMPSAVAYQAGATGTFQTLALSGSSVTFTLPSGTTAYGLAYQCPTFVSVFSFSNQSIIQATTTDTTSLSLACPSVSGSVSATFNVSAIPGATSTMLYVGYHSDEMYGTSGSQGISGIPTGTFDVALEAIGANGALAIQIQRGVNVTSATPSVAFPPMTAANELGAAPASLTGVPAGTTGGFSTTYNTSGGLSVILPGPFNGKPQSTYPTVPSSQSQAGDFYLIDAGANLTTQPSESLSALMSSNTASAVTVALPSPSDSLTAPAAAAFPTFNANTSGFSVQGTIVDSSWTQFQNPAVNHTVYNTYTYVTKTWLGTNTTFTVPDLSALTGFAPAPPSGEREFWGLYSTAAASLQFLPMQQSGVESYTSPLSVQSISTGGAFTVP